MSKIVLNSFGALFKKSIVSNNFWNGIQQVRTTYVLKRRNTPLLTKLGEKKKKLRHRDRIYETVEHLSSSKKPPITVILTQDVEGIGSAGQVVEVRPEKARLELLLPLKAVYASPENLEKLEEQKAKGLITPPTNSSLWAPLTAKMLSTFMLAVVMNMDNEWTLEPWHIRVSFRKAGWIVPEDAISMLEPTISGPNLELEGKEFPVKVTINNKEWVYVRCRLHHWSKNESRKLPEIPDHWRFPAESMFPENTELLNSLPMPCRKSATKVDKATSVSNFMTIT